MGKKLLVLSIMTLFCVGCHKTEPKAEGRGCDCEDTQKVQHSLDNEPKGDSCGGCDSCDCDKASKKPRQKSPTNEKKELEEENENDYDGKAFIGSKSKEVKEEVAKIEEEKLVVPQKEEVKVVVEAQEEEQKFSPKLS